MFFAAVTTMSFLLMTIFVLAGVLYIRPMTLWKLQNYSSSRFQSVLSFDHVYDKPSKSVIVYEAYVIKCITQHISKSAHTHARTSLSQPHTHVPTRKYTHVHTHCVTHTNVHVHTQSHMYTFTCT